MPDPETESRLAPFAQYRFGWSWLGRDLQVRGLGIPDEGDDLLRGACGVLGQQLRLDARFDPQTAASRFANAMQPGAWDTLYRLLRLAGPALAWSDVPGAQTNIITGGPVSRGQIDSAGNFVPTAPDDVIAGFGLPSPAIKLGKRFLFASDPDVNLYLYPEGRICERHEALRFGWRHPVRWQDQQWNAPQAAPRRRP